MRPPARVDHCPGRTERRRRSQRRSQVLEQIPVLGITHSPAARDHDARLGHVHARALRGLALHDPGLGLRDVRREGLDRAGRRSLGRTENVRPDRQDRRRRVDRQANEGLTGVHGAPSGDLSAVRADSGHVAGEGNVE